MNKNGLLVEPKFDEPNFYLTEGEMTKITPQIMELAQVITSNDGISEKMIVKNIISFINNNTSRLKNKHDNRKFKRSAQEILTSKERTGCCDSATLFRALSIACGIPTMQIICLDQSNYKRSGHFFCGVYINNNDKKWYIIDSDQKACSVDEVKFSSANISDRNIKDGTDYAYAYTVDYRDVAVNGFKIDCIENMHKIGEIAYDLADKRDIRSSQCL